MLKKIVSISLGLIFFYISVIFSLSIALTQQGFYSFFSKYFLEGSPSFSLTQANWHPIRPSVVIEDLKIDSDYQKITLGKVTAEFSLLNLINENLISRVNIADVLIDNQKNRKQTLDLFSFIDFSKYIEELNIKGLKVKLYEGSQNMSLDLNSVSSFEGVNLNLKLSDRNGESLEMRLSPNLASNGAIFNGYVRAERFNVDKNLLRNFCKSCDSDAELQTSIHFSIFESKLLSLHGNLDLNLDREILGFSSLSSSFRLKDFNQTSIQVSSFLNKDSKFKVPEFFLYLSPDDTKIIFPEINLSKNYILRHILERSYSNFSLDLNGTLRNLVIRLNDDPELLSASIVDLGVNHETFGLQGLAGQLTLNEEKSKVIIYSPSIAIKSKKYLDKELIFNDFKSLLSFRLVGDDLEILPSEFSALINDLQFEGLISVPPVPTIGIGNVNLRIKSNFIGHKLALSLFPNTSNLSTTKSTINSLIECGSFEDINLILRLPIDGVYKNNSESFGIQASVKDGCLNINGYELKKINSRFNLNNDSLSGDFKNAELLNSSITADYAITKNLSEQILNIRGESDGPFVSVLNLLGGKNLNQENTEGVHKTIFEYTTPLRKKISFLDEDATLEVKSQIEKGSFDIEDFGLTAGNINSSLEWNNSDGFSKGLFSLDLNSIPINFELDSKLSGKDYSVFIARNSLNLNSFLPTNMKNKIVGSSKTTFQLFVPSLLKGRPLKEIYIHITSNLAGTEVNLPLPLYKAINSNIDLSIDYFPAINASIPRLKFRYGDLFRGKFNILNDGLEGFIIAGKKKQSISIERKKLSLIGFIPKLDISLLSLLDVSSTNKASAIDIKKLEIGEIVLSNFVFSETLLSSEISDNYLEIAIKNNNLSGKVYLPRITSLQPIIDLETVNFNFSETTSDSIFLDIYNNFNQELAFRTNSLILNSVNYGNWSFNVEPTKESITIKDIKGSYGKWGLTLNKEGISRLSISKKGIGWRTDFVSKIYSGSPEKGFLQFGIEPNFEMDTIFAETNLFWNSLPWNFDYDNIYGDIYLEVEGLVIEDREDLQRQNNILRLINIFNITDSFEKVTNLDFRKLYKSGFSSDSVKGTFNITPTLINLDSPMIFKSGSSEFKWRGRIERNQNGDLNNLDLEVVMTLPLREYLPAYAFLLGGPITAGIVYIAGKAFQKNLDQLSSGSWSIKGSLDEPKTNFNGWFEDSRG